MDETEAPAQKLVHTYQKTFPLLPVFLAEGGMRWLWPTYFLLTWDIDELGTTTFVRAKYMAHEDLTALQLAEENRVIHISQLDEF